MKWESLVQHGTKTWLVKTLECEYELYDGVIMQYEVFVWKYSIDFKMRGRQVYHFIGDQTHQSICEQLNERGKVGVAHEAVLRE